MADVGIVGVVAVPVASALATKRLPQMPACSGTAGGSHSSPRLPTTHSVFRSVQSICLLDGWMAMKSVARSIAALSVHLSPDHCAGMPRETAAEVIEAVRLVIIAGKKPREAWEAVGKHGGEAGIQAIRKHAREERDAAAAAAGVSHILHWLYQVGA